LEVRMLRVVLEVDRAALAVGEGSVGEYLQQDGLKTSRVRLLRSSNRITW